MARKSHTQELIFIGFLLGTLAAAIALSIRGIDTSGWRQAVILTARVSIIFFLLTFIVRPLAQKVPNVLTRAMLRERRGLGLCFASAHTVHLLAVCMYLAGGGEVPGRLAVGMDVIGVGLLGAMAATSNDWSIARLGTKRWKYLHTIGMYYLWMIFFVTYLARIRFSLSSTVYVIYFCAVVLTLLFRIYVRISPKKKKYSLASVG